MNLKELFTVCKTVESCNYYLDMAEYMAENKQIYENELHTFRRIGRQKYQQLAGPEVEPVKVVESGTYLYTPERGQEKAENCDMKPDCVIMVCTTG